jgi:hypothetical protein
VSNPEATGGFPSKTAAVADCLDRGVTKPKAIADETGVPLSSVYSLLSQIRQRRKLADIRAGHAADVEPTPGLWTPEKLSKARRLFGTTMIFIAEALQVPPAELLAYGLKGVIPPMGKGQRIGQLLSDLAMEAEPPADPAEAEPLALPAPDEDERAADEALLAKMEDGDAELDDGDDVQPAPEADPGGEEEGASGTGTAALEGTLPPVDGDEPVEPHAIAVAAATARFKLRTEAGEYLHDHERGMTRLTRFIWRGTAQEVRSLKRKKPHFRNLIEEPC